MAKQVIELDVPDGWELTGEFRRAMNGEAILETIPLRAVHVAQPMGTEGPRLILRKVEPVRESRWLNIHNKSAVGHMRVEKSECDFHEHPCGRSGLIRLDFSGDDLVHVALEPKEGLAREGQEGEG